MRKLKISIHSFVDIITNSSTEIYTYVTNVENAFKMINEILKIAGCEKKAEDLFNVLIVPNDWDDIIENAEEVGFEDEELTKEFNNLLTNRNAVYEDKSWEGQNKFDEEKLIPFLMKDERWKKFHGDEYYNETRMIIESKDKSKSDKDIWNMIFDLFSQEGISG